MFITKMEEKNSLKDLVKLNNYETNKDFTKKFGNRN